MSDDTPDTHRPELIGVTDCPACGEPANTWWEVPIPEVASALAASGAEGVAEVYRVSCSSCKHSETW